MYETIAELFTNMESGPHIPVMPSEVLVGLNVPQKGVVVDCTVGLAGHSLSLARALGVGGTLIGIDRDKEALFCAQEKLKESEPECIFQQGDFRNIDRILKQLNIFEVDSMLFDLGISSFQMDNPDRGFSFRADGPLDMRMDQESFISAYDLINSLSEKEIAIILRDYGEERWYKRIAHKIVAERAQHPIESTKELAELVEGAIPFRSQRERIHPATRTFQAFRIAVNRELESLDIALNKVVNYVKKGGRLAVISFHSLEDRIVKNRFRDFEKRQRVKVLTKKPLRPAEEEVASNSRARSARLRIVEIV